MKKSQNMPVWLSKIVLSQNFVQFAEASKRHSKPMHLPEKGVIDMI
jgi:hypothetical protein